MSPRTGRPTDNPKGKPIHVRLDANSEAILDKYTRKRMSLKQKLYDAGSQNYRTK